MLTVAWEIRSSYEEGIDVWDCEWAEDILTFVIPLADLGDNPMQSEMSCHIGLKGKCYCRCCMVRGKDKEDNEALGGTTVQTGEES